MIIRILGFYRLLKILFFSKKQTDFTDYTNIWFFTEYSVFNDYWKYHSLPPPPIGQSIWLGIG